MSLANFVREQLDSYFDKNKFGVNSKGDPYLFVRLNTVLYGWLLQTRYGVVERQRLYGLVGRSFTKQVDNPVIQKDLKKNGFFQYLDETRFVFTREAMEAIQRVFDEPAYNYGLTLPMPYLVQPGMTGAKFLEYTYLLADEVQSSSVVDVAKIITESISQAFEHVLPGVRYEIPFRNECGQVSLITGPDHSWHFLLITYPHSEKLTINQLKDCSWELHFVKDTLGKERKLNDLQSMVIAPYIDDDEARKKLATQHRYMHLFGNSSVLRFFHMLNVNQDLLPLIAKEFMLLLTDPIISGSKFIDEVAKKYRTQ